MPVESSTDPVRRPSHWRYLRGYIHCLEEIGAPTIGNLGKALGVTKTAVWLFQKRHPEVIRWVNAVLLEQSLQYLGGVQRKVAHLAMRGSPAHAEIFFKVVNGAYARAQQPGDAPDPLTGSMQPIFNILIPRPEPAALPAAPAALPPVLDIPTIAVSRG